MWSWVSGVRIPSLTPLKPQVRRPGPDRGRAVQHDHYPILGADLRISAAHGGDSWEPILRPALRGQPELLTGRGVKDPARSPAHVPVRLRSRPWCDLRPRDAHSLQQASRHRPRPYPCRLALLPRDQLDSQALPGVAEQQTLRLQAHNTNPADGDPWVLTNPLPGPTMAAASLCLACFARRRRENDIGGTGTPSAPPGWRRPRSRLRRTRRSRSDHRRWR